MKQDQQQSQEFENGDLRGKLDKKIVRLDIPTPGNRDEQASQQGGGAAPQDQK
jgi:hypothetical protein